MEIVTLATTALALASPFLEKVGEGTARKIGEDIWNFIKKPLQKRDKNIEELPEKDIHSALVAVLQEDEVFKVELEKIVMISQTKTDSFYQSINNNGNIDKQVNIGNVNGNIKL